MKDRLKELENRKTIQEYSYTKVEFEYKKTLFDENSKEFLNLAYKIVGKEREITEEKNIEENQIREQKLEDEKNIPSKIDPYIKEKAKKLYREISKRTHPDRDPEGIYTEIFMDAAESYEGFKLLDLYQHCEKLGIQYEIEDEDIELFKSEISINRTQIDALEKTFVYIWSIQSDEKMKDVIIRQFIRTMGDKM